MRANPKPSLQEIEAIHPPPSTSIEETKDYDLKRQAKNATDREHKLSLLGAIKLYPKAVVFSLVFSTAIIMEGYDIALIGSLYGYTA